MSSDPRPQCRGNSSEYRELPGPLRLYGEAGTPVPFLQSILPNSRYNRSSSGYLPQDTPMRWMSLSWLSLIGWFTLCFAVAGISGRWTAVEVATWYRTLDRPAIAPPDWVFGPVWTLLYALMAVAASQVSQTQPSRARTLALGCFLLQLALNFAWSWLFFHQHRIGTALVENLLLWAAIAATIAAFAMLSHIAAWLLAPYIAWVSFAILLNYEFWRMNR